MGISHRSSEPFVVSEATGHSAPASTAIFSFPSSPSLHGQNTRKSTGCRLIGEQTGARVRKVGVGKSKLLKCLPSILASSLHGLFFQSTFFT